MPQIATNGAPRQRLASTLSRNVSREALTEQANAYHRKSRQHHTVRYAVMTGHVLLKLQKQVEKQDGPGQVGGLGRETPRIFGAHGQTRHAAGAPARGGSGNAFPL